MEDFVGTLFGIDHELRDLQARHHELAPLYAVKRKFVQRKALTGYTPEKASEIDGFTVGAELEAFMLAPLTERSFADHVARWLESEAEHTEPLRLAALYAAWATLTPEGKAKHHSGILFKTPHKLDMHHLVPAESVETSGLVQLQFSQRPLASSRRLPAHRRRNRSHRRARSGQLLHQMPQPGQRQLLHRP